MQCDFTGTADRAGSDGRRCGARHGLDFLAGDFGTVVQNTRDTIRTRGRDRK